MSFAAKKSRARKATPLGRSPKQSSPPRVATISELRRHMAELFRGTEPVLVTKNGSPVGFIQPAPRPNSIPMAERTALYREFVAEIRRQQAALGITEEQVDREVDALFSKPRRRR